MGEDTDGHGGGSRTAAPVQAGDGSPDYLVSAPGRSPALDAGQLEVLLGYGTERDVAAGEVLFADGEETYDLKMRRCAELPKRRGVGENRPLPVSPG